MFVVPQLLLARLMVAVGSPAATTVAVAEAISATLTVVPLLIVELSFEDICGELDVRACVQVQIVPREGGVGGCDAAAGEDLMEAVPSPTPLTKAVPRR